MTLETGYTLYTGKFCPLSSLTHKHLKVNKDISSINWHLMVLKHITVLLFHTLNSHGPSSSNCKIGYRYRLSTVSCGTYCLSATNPRQMSFWQNYNKKLSYHRGIARRTISVKISSNAVRKINFKGLQQGMALKVIEGHPNCLISLPITGL